MAGRGHGERRLYLNSGREALIWSGNTAERDLALNPIDVVAAVVRGPIRLEMAAWGRIIARLGERNAALVLLTLILIFGAWLRLTQVDGLGRTVEYFRRVLAAQAPG
jgi:hypothetical protein